MVVNWEQSYREKDTPWDLGGAAPPLISLLKKEGVNLLTGQTVLVPGCGYGHDAEALRRVGLEVTGLDLAPTALKSANQLYGDAVRWLEGDFLDASMVPEHSVDMIFEHTCFCAIEPEQRSDYVKSAKHWLAPGGFLLGVFFTDPPPREDGASGPPFGVSLDELRGLFGESFTIRREQSPDRSHPDRLGREVIIEMVRNT